MSYLPQDPVILLSYVNTKLRDRYPSLDELCEEEDVPRSAIETVLSAIGYRYDCEENKFTQRS